MSNRNPCKFSLIALAVLLCAAAAERQVNAQQAYEVEYRLVNWKTLHFHEAGKANLHFKTMKDLGCEAKQHPHNGHIDVTYRCPAWRRITLPTDAEAHNWERWLKSSGFETKHQH
jgi:hypothetical protein